MNRSKILKIVAGSLACVALGGALFYYNFVDEYSVEKLNVGDPAPDFVVQTYKIEDGTFKTGGEDFQLSKQDKITVVNFWETWCGPCKEELPYFNRLQEEYGEYVEVIALAGTGGYEGLVKNFFNTDQCPDGWEDFTLTFGYYETTDNNVYASYGLTGAVPATAIVDVDGKVTYIKTGEMTYEELFDKIEPLLPDHAEDAPDAPVEPAQTSKKNWWKENALGVTFLALSTAALGAAITVSAVSTAKKEKEKGEITA